MTRMARVAGLDAKTAAAVGNGDEAACNSAANALTTRTELDLSQGATQVRDGTSSTPLDDLSPVAALPQLMTLRLGGNEFRSLEPLRNLPALATLDLRGSHISTLAPLARLTSLTDLDLTSNPVTDLAPLAGLRQLARLVIVGTLVEDLDDVAGIARLTNVVYAANGDVPDAPLSPSEEACPRDAVSLGVRRACAALRNEAL
jgi:Leucine-rich repeat (LRR) protein